MTEEGVEKIMGALKVITEQCRAALSCKNCPFSYFCQCMDYLSEPRPDMWFRKVGVLK